MKLDGYGYCIPCGYMGFVDGRYMLFETETAYREYLKERED